MSDSRFDISFDGTLKPEADPARTREQLRVLFKLDQPGVERLFCGKRVVIKRGVDAATAARYKRAFEEVGAVLQVIMADAPAEPGERPAGPAQGSDGLTLAPLGGFLEEPPEVKMVELDISHLSLVPGPEWSLADCEPDPPNVDPPDTSHLKLADMEERPDDSQER